MQLHSLLSDLSPVSLSGDMAIEITGLTYDSRRVSPGDIFVAMPGEHFDGHDFLSEAWRRGAAAVVDRFPVAPPAGRAGVTVEDPREALAVLAAAFYHHPSRSLRVIGVTGTNGKTTTTHLIRDILRSTGRRVGLIGTVHNLIDDEELPVKHTTPEASDLQELLRRMVDSGVEDVAMEVSSHALVLKRVRSTAFDVAVLTNLTQDHLDYHGTMQAYQEAKARLFVSLSEGGKPDPLSVLNIDDPWFSDFRRVVSGRFVTFGLSRSADVRAEEVQLAREGTTMRLVTPAGQAFVRLPLPGRFNVANALAAAAVAYGLGIDTGSIAEALDGARGVAGRFEPVEGPRDYSVVVDYAHTPDGLQKILGTAREITGGRIILVFGCGGDRDRGKRPLMGEIAGKMADYTVITSDNPRTEDPEAIMAEIEIGMNRVPGAEYRLVADRRQAIFEAVSMAQAGDLVLIAGKGHETYQIFANETVPFDDRVVAGEAVRRRDG